MSKLQENVEMLRAELTSLHARKASETVIATEYGDDWSDPQWQGYHCNQEHLQERIEYLEECLRELG